jgi:hypothetical protein
MTNLNTRPEPAPAHVDPAPALDTDAKIAPQSGDHKDPIAEPPKS